MKKTHGIVAGMVVAMAVGALAEAQPAFGGRGEHGRSPLGRLERTAEFLELSDDQQFRAKELLEQARPDQQRIHEQIREQAGRLRELLSAESPDPTAVGEATITMHRLREETRAARKSLESAFEALLTPEQLRKWEILEAGRVNGGRGHRARRPGRGPEGRPEAR